MPKSKGRKPKPGQRIRSAGKTAQSRGQYRPGKIRVDDEQAFAMLQQLQPEQLLTVGLPVWWLMLLPGKPANLCLEGGLALREAFGVFGIEAQPKLVELIVHNQETGRATQYGRPDPHFSNGSFVGHAGLWPPESKRFIDHSAQQYPPIRAVSWLPVSLHTASSGMTTWGTQRLGVPRGDDLLLEYIPVDEDVAAEVFANCRLLANQQEFHRVGINVASNLLALLRMDHMRDKALASPHPRLHALLKAVGNTELINDHDRYHRFLLPEDPNGVYLDQIAI